MPFALDEPQPLKILQNILDAILIKDIARISDISTSEIDLIGKMVRFISRSSGVDGISYSSLSKNIGITKYKAQQYTKLRKWNSKFQGGICAFHVSDTELFGF